MKRGVLVGMAALAAIAAVIVWVVGFDSSAADKAPPFVASDSLVKAECLTGTYLPSEISGLKLEGRPVPRDWSEVEDAPAAMQPDRSAVEVTIRPRPGLEEITLTGIHFDVDQLQLRPLGIVFYRPCRRQITGPAIEVDLDRSGGIDASSSNGTLGRGLKLESSGKPIEFPWTVPLTEPLHLYLVVHGEHSYCTWTARISWESDSGNGVIRVDNGGKKYRMTDTLGIRWDHPGADGLWIHGKPPSWVGVR